MDRNEMGLLALVACILALALVPGAGHAQDEVRNRYEEAFLVVNRRERRVTVVHLDGTLESVRVPLPLERHICAYDVTPFGKMIYCAHYSRSDIPRIRQHVALSRDDDRAGVLYLGYWSNALRNLDPVQIDVSRDGTGLALTCRRKGTASRPVLLCLNLLTGKLVQLTDFGNVARSPKWSADSKKLAFLLGKDKHLSEDGNRFALCVSEDPLGESPETTQVAPPMEPDPSTPPFSRPAWAEGDNVVYFQGLYRSEIAGPGDYCPRIYRTGLRTGRIEHVGKGHCPVSDALGQCVAYAGRPYGSGVYLVDKHDDDAKQVAKGRTSVPAISDSGKYVCFVDEEDKDRRIRVVDRDSGNTVLLVENPGGVASWIRIWKPEAARPRE